MRQPENEATKIDIIIEFDTIKIYIKTILFLAIRRDEYVGLQSWIEGEMKWKIEFYLKTTSIITEFNSKEKWKAMLTELDKMNI